MKHIKPFNENIETSELNEEYIKDILQVLTDEGIKFVIYPFCCTLLPSKPMTKTEMKRLGYMSYNGSIRKQPPQTPSGYEIEFEFDNEDNDSDSIKMFDDIQDNTYLSIYETLKTIMSNLLLDGYGTIYNSTFAKLTIYNQRNNSPDKFVEDRFKEDRFKHRER